MKIAILQYKPISAVMSAYGILSINIATSLSNLGHNVEIFSIGRITKDNFLTKRIKQHIIKGSEYRENGISVYRFIDFLALYLLNFRPSVNLLNNNYKFVSAITEFNPDILIVSSVQMSFLTQQCKNKIKNIKVIVYTDSPETINASFDSINYSNIPNVIKKLVGHLLREKYNRYMLNLYKNLIFLSDAIVVPTEKDRCVINNKFKIHKNRIFVIPPIFIQNKNTSKATIKRIKIITFIGAANYGPNMEAVKIIKERIAPKLQHMKFIIVGKGWAPTEFGNIQIVGEVRDIKKILHISDVCIAPITTGGGMKTKIATYLEAGLPIIGTSVAFEGYAIKNKVNAIVENDVDMFWERILEIDKDRNLLNRLQRNAPEVLKNFSGKKVKRKWQKVITALV